jgi:hypothetical protein
VYTAAQLPVLKVAPEISTARPSAHQRSAGEFVLGRSDHISRRAWLKLRLTQTPFLTLTFHPI